MALGLFAVKGRCSKKITINVDSQAAIRAVTERTSGPGKYIMDEFHNLLDAYTKKNTSMAVEIRWAPGHTGIVGNEAADVAAKEAAEGNGSPTKEVPRFLRKTLPRSKSAAKQAFRVAVKEAAREAWSVAPQSKHLR
ncbi:hypothetical protein AX14_002203, partial [Amanita brunnescens Koide BX004]